MSTAVAHSAPSTVEPPPVGPAGKRHVARDQRRAGWGTYAIVAAIMVLYLFPLAFLINTSLKSNNGFYANPNGLTHTFAWHNFVTAWNEGHFGADILNSVLYTGVSAGVGTLVSLALAFPVSRGYIKHTRIWYGLFAVVLFLPNMLISQFQLILRLGLYGDRIGYILIMTGAVGIGPLLLSGYLKSVSTELDEAAALDGVGYWRFLFTFIVPIIRPALATVFILLSIAVWNDLIIATVLLPNPSTSPMVLGLYAFQGAYSSQFALLAAATMIVVFPLLLGFLFMQRYLISDALRGALKG
jgi:raffinose/stachyose/melibiose transport system permease protein